MTPALRAKLERLLGSSVIASSAVGGGSINETLRVDMSNGRRVFVKTHDAPPPHMYQREALGLAFLADAHTLRVPAVICASERDEHGPACLVLEHVASAPTRADHDELLGRGLAALHRHGAPSFGLDHDNYIATLPQDNTPTTTWVEFYRDRRLLAQLGIATKAKRAPASLVRKLDALCDVLAARVGPVEAPARLHGDLWSGNCITDERGEPVLIDPAAYGGHREVDLAMMRLFGGFSSRVFAAYDEAFPLAPGSSERVALYQLYFLLVHVNLFGGHYVSSTERVLDSLL